MTDFFGIGPAIKASVVMYETCARGSGRTLSLVNSLKEGDRVVFTNTREAKRVKELAKERGITIDYVVIDPKTPHTLFELRPSQGRSIFDHSWVEQYFKNAIDRAAQDIRYFQTNSSGFGEEHLETNHRASEYSKFRVWEG